MTEPISMWILSGMGGTMLLLLGAIYSEIKSMNRNFHELSLTQNSSCIRIDVIEKTIYKIPCLNSFNCTKG
jgi:hypothetical protein